MLVVRAGGLGDILLLRRVVAALRRAGREVVLLAPGASGSALLGPGPGEVGRLLPWERADVAALFSDALSARPLRAELARCQLALAYTRSEALTQTLRALIPRVVAHDPQPPRGTGHVSRWLCAALTGEDRVAALPEPPPHEPTPEEEAGVRPWAERLGASFLALHPGSGSPRKNWPAERFAALVQAWCAGRPWLLIEGPGDAQVSAPLRGLAGVVGAVGLPVRMLGALVRHCGAYVGNDSGVSHLAAAWDAPTVALFGPTDPDVWAPVGPRVRVVRSKGADMEGIAVDAVLEAVREAQRPREAHALR